MTNNIARAYFDYAISGIIETDRDGRILRVNPAAVSITGFDVKLLLGEALQGLMLDEGRVARHFVLLQEQGISQVELALSRRDGETIQIALSSVEVADNYFMHVFDDVTRERQATAEIEKARAEAEAANQAKSAFLASISHELRTPLHGIIGLGQLLQHSPLNVEQQDYASKIVSSGQTLLKILNDLLDSAKIEAGQMSYEQQPFAIAHLLTELEPLVKQSQLSCVIDVAPDVPANVLGDRLRLGQCLRNLFSNALKFTQQGSVQLRVDVWQKQLRFQVIDSGMGMSSATIDKLFSPFTQADNSISRRFGGTGLGLYLTREMAQGMGGTLSVSSQLGQGSCFTLTMPLQIALVPHIAQVNEINDVPQEFAGRYILVAEDNPVNQLLIERCLQLAHIKTQLALDGEEVLEKLVPMPDLILMDVHMPRQDGLATTRMLRAQGCQLPIIGLSAAASKSEQQACFDAGMNDFLPKPLDMDELWGCLTRWLAPVEVVTLENESLAQRFLNNQDAYQQAKNIFISHHGGDVARLRQLFAEHQLNDFQQVAHSLRGAAAMLEMTQIAQIAQQLEMAGFDECLMASLQQCFEAL